MLTYPICSGAVYIVFCSLKKLRKRKKHSLDEFVQINVSQKFLENKASLFRLALFFIIHSVAFYSGVQILSKNCIYFVGGAKHPPQNKLYLTT